MSKILIVEDEGITALSIKSLLENYGYENPLIALSGTDIFQKVVKYKPDLILMDINLNEDMDGIEIAKQLQTDFNIPIIYLTAHCDEAIVERAKLTEHYGYIVKPFNDEELRITIDHALYRYKMEKDFKHFVFEAFKTLGFGVQEMEFLSTSKAKTLLLKELKKANKRLQIELGEKKRVQTELKHSEKKFRGIVEQSHDGIVIVDKNGALIEWNYGMEEITGYKREHVLGKLMWDIHNEIHPENDHGIHIHSKADVMQFIKSRNCKLSDKLFEAKILGIDGSRRHIQIRHFPIKIDGAKMAASIVRDVTRQKEMEEELKIAKNNLELKVRKRTQEFIKSNEELKKEISERKHAQKALIESRNFLDKIINSIADPVFVKDKKHRWILLNDAFCKLMGYSREELLGKSDYDFLAAHEASIFWDKDEEVFKTGIENVNEEEVTDSDGNLHTLITKKTLYVDNSGKKYLVAVIRDITELKRAEKAIKKSEAYYKTIFENTGAATFIIEEDTTISLANAEFEKICGYSKEEIEGIKSWKEFVFGSYSVKMETYHNLRRIEPNLAPRKYEFKFVDKYGNVKNVLTTIDMIPETKKSLASILDITDKKMAIDALRESEAQLKIAMDMAKLVHWEYDVNLDLFTFDNQFYKLYGTNMDREGGSRMSSKEYAQKFLPPEESPMVMEEIVAALETDDPDFSRKVEHTIIRADGERRFVLVYYEIIKDDEGRTIKTYGVNQDITELKKAEKELKENEQKYRTLFNSSPDFTILVGVDGILLDVNYAAQEIVGLSRENLVGKNFTELDLLLDEEMSLHIEKVSQVLEGKNVKPFESRFIDKNSKIHYVETYLKALKKDGKIFAFNVISHDITERKRAEKEIDENLKKLDMLNRVIVAANSSDDLQSLLKDILNLVLEFMNFEVGAIYLIDENEGLAKLEYFTEDSDDSSNDINNLKIKEYPFSQVYIDGISLFVNNFEEISTRNLKPRNFESLAIVPIYSKGRIIGSFNILSIKKHNFTQKEKEIINSIGREIGSTISKLITEEKMKKLITELKRSNDELQQFAYITSHDLQEPLRTIASFTQLLERRYKNKLDGDADEFIDYIVEASIRMKQMILDLLEYSRLTRVEKKCEPLKIEDMLLNIFDNLNLLIIENKAQITYGNLPVVFADESQLFRVFQNLIENAIKFKREDENPKIHISSYFDEENNEHVFSISDNGIGIEEQYFGRIFTLFQRLHTKEEYDGTGIGLSISKRIIESHGGKMWVESEYGAGSTFYFTLMNRP
ncbi:PAS domain S-box protein [Methanobacterium sp.]|uniref:PAS domain S-box protein n=1 Tax=Methanobacterium sp. TaxID=2164 RepID=UPI003C747FA7